MKLPRKRFVIIRHGETDANRDGLIAGRTEAQLTQQGHQDASGLCDWHWPREIAVFVSPQQRAQETARLGFPNAEIVTLDGLRERDWGIFEGRPIAEAPARVDTPEDGEAWGLMLFRVAREIEVAQSLASGALPVLVAHSGVIRAVRELTGGTAHGPSPANTLPYLFTPSPDGWTETSPVRSNLTWMD